MRKALRYILYEYIRTITITKCAISIILFAIAIGDSLHGILNMNNTNVWDAVFLTLANSRKTCLFFLLAFILFIDNTIIDYELESTILTKVNSRELWWNSKVFVLLSKTICFIIIPTGFLLIISFIKLPFENGWSDFMLKASLNNQALKVEALSNDPISILVQILMLLILSFFTIGLLVAVLTLAFNSRIIGLLTGIFMWIITITPVFAVKSSLIAKITFNHIDFNSHRFIGSVQGGATIFQSILYWIGLIMILYIMGYHISLKRDFIGVKS